MTEWLDRRQVLKEPGRQVRRLEEEMELAQARRDINGPDESKEQARRTFVAGCIRCAALDVLQLARSFPAVGGRLDKSDVLRHVALLCDEADRMVDKYEFYVSNSGTPALHRD